MKKSQLLTAILVVAMVGIFFAIQTEAIASSGTEGNYRVPIIGSFRISRIDCVRNIGDPSNPNDDIDGHSGTMSNGGRFMDIYIPGNDSDYGAPIYSSGGGTVKEATISSSHEGFGSNVVVENSEVSFRYAHLAKIYVQVGHPIKKGDLIGLIGSTGWSTGPHLHWEAWQMNGSGFNLMSIPGISLNNSTPGLPCTNQDAGTIVGQSIFHWNSCPEFFSENYPFVVLFDHKDCRGNVHVLPNPVTYNISTTFNDRTRSVYIPPGMSAIVSAHVNDPVVLKRCLINDMWNLDTDVYESSTIQIGWDPPSDNTVYNDAYNMISSVTVLNNGNCSYNSALVLASAPGTVPSVTGYISATGTGTGGSGGEQTGDDPVDLRANPEFSGTQYGWSNPSGGWFNLSPDVNYMDNQTSSIAVDPGWSLMVAQDQDGGGFKKCFVRSEPELSNAYYESSATPITDTISSVWVYQDSTCGGNYLGTEPADTITVWNHPSYSGDRYGYHDPGLWNFSGYSVNSVTSIGVTPGWSTVVYEGANITGGFTCFKASDPWLPDNRMNNGAGVDDNIESIEVFHDTNCGGRMHPPAVSLTANVTNLVTGEFTVTIDWSGAAPRWHDINLGDGRDNGEYGSSGNFQFTRNFAPGVYTVTVVVYGTDSIGYQYTQLVDLTIPDPTLSLTFSQGTTANTYNCIEAEFTWSNAAANGHGVDWGDASNLFLLSGSSGQVSQGHCYTDGDQQYNLVLFVVGIDENDYIEQLPVYIVPPIPTLTPEPNADPDNAVPSLNVFTTSTPTLTWNRVTWATEYLVQVDSSSSFTSPIDYRVIVPATSLDLTTAALPSGIYYWRVRAKRVNGTWGPWSTRDSFTIST